MLRVSNVVEADIATLKQTLPVETNALKSAPILSLPVRESYKNLVRKTETV